MKTATHEKLHRLKTAIAKDCLVFVRVAGSTREYAVSAVRQNQHTLELELAGAQQSLVIEPEELGVVRLVENND